MDDFIPVDYEDPFIIGLRQQIAQNGLPSLPWKNWYEKSAGPFSWADLAAAKKTIADVLTEPPDGEQKDSSKKISIKGIINSGNMCYMNSILQVLIHCQPFGDVLVRIRNQAQYRINSDTPILDALADFIGYFMGSSDTSLSSESLYTVVQRRFPHLKRGRQEDAQEFLGYLLQALDEELEMHGKLEKEGLQQQEQEEEQEEEDPSSWVEIGKKHKPNRNNVIKTSETVISRIFGGQFKSVLEVGNRPSSATFEPFEQVQLDIDDSRIETLENAFDLMSLPETLSYRLTNGTEVKAVKTLTIDKVPNVLIVHLKRFAFSEDGIRKIAKPITIPQTLELGTQTKDLFAVVYHHGPVATAGHYTVDLKVDGKWYQVDDTAISEMSTHGVLEDEPGKSAYLLFYSSRLTPVITH